MSHPIQTGFYHFRGTDETEWEVVHVRKGGIEVDSEFDVLFPESGTVVCITALDGSWMRIPTPDEMQEAWAVYLGGEIIEIGKTKQDAINNFAQLMGASTEDQEVISMLWDYSEEKEGYTCKPVAIVPRESEVEG